MRRFTDTTIFTDIGCIITSQLTLQRLHTLLRPISHVASSPRHLSHSPDLCFHIYHHSLVRFACLSAKDCGTPRTVTLRSLWSCRSHTHRTAFGFLGFVVVRCTDQAIISVSARPVKNKDERFMCESENGCCKLDAMNLPLPVPHHHL